MNLSEKQQTVINHNHGNMLVSAAAGSGKTFTMIERLCRLVSEKRVKISEILAVTFTEKAAAELKSRLREKIISGGDQTIKEQLSDLYTADICTFHAFCSRILRTYFFVAGVAADFTICDASKVNEIKNKVLSELFDDLYEKNDVRLSLLVDRHEKKRRDDNLKKIILELYDVVLSEEKPFEILEKSLDYCNEEGLKLLCKKAEEEINQKIKSFIFKILELKVSAENLGLIKYVSLLEQMLLFAEDKGEYPARMPTLQKLSDEGKLINEQIKDIRSSLGVLAKEKASIKFSESEKEKQEASQSHLEALIFIIKTFHERFNEEKRELNVVDYSDLEHLALKILENQEVRLELKNKYKVCCVDEYQDTNGVQEKILSYVTDDNLLMVGDLKQSIYGFRGCNSDLFKEKEKNLGSNVVYLNSNFRSSDKVIDGVNAIFNECMTLDTCDVDYKGVAQLIKGGKYPEGSGRFSIDIFNEEEEELPEEKPRIYDVLEETSDKKEQYKIGDFIVNIINEELEKDFYDVKTEKWRKVTYGDIAVLTRNRTSYSENIMKALISHGIPVIYDSKDNITEYAEIKTLIDLLNAIDNLNQDVPLVSSMKNLFAFTDDEFVDIRLFYKNNNQERLENFFEAYKFFKEKAQGPLKEKVEKFHSYMESLRILSADTNAGDILEKAVSDCALDVKFLSSVTGDQKIKKVRRFISEAQTKNLSVRGFLEHVKNAKKDFTLAESSNENAVKMITFHASKGLEFPVVIFAGLDTKFNFLDAQNEILYSRKHGLGLNFYDDKQRSFCPTVAKKFIKQDIIKETVKEEIRLLYVALTRAKYALHIVGEKKPQFKKEKVFEAKCYADFIPNWLCQNEYDESFIKSLSGGEEVRKVAVLQPDKTLSEEIKSNFTFKYADEERTLLPLKTTVTESIKEEEENKPVFVFTEEVFHTETAEAGTAMHKFLEKCDFFGEAPSLQAQKMLEAGALEQREYDLISLDVLEKLFASNIFESLSGYKLYKEKQFIASVPAKKVLQTNVNDEILLQGVIDLLAIKDGQAVIYDYKYSGKSAKALKETYSKQLELYAYAVEKCLNLKVSGAYVISLKKAEIVKIDI